MKNANKLFYTIIILFNCFIFNQHSLQGQCNSNPEYIALAALQNANPSSSLNWDLSDCNYCNWDGVTCAGGNIVFMKLNFRGLAVIPSEIGNLDHLSTLRLISNNISSIPPELGNLNNLKVLNLTANQITVIPPELGNLNKLFSLNLALNQISAIPPEVGNLTNLKDLSLSSNQITFIPSLIGNLINLTDLSFRNNKITAIPPEFGNLIYLTKLDLDNNKITVIPPEMGNLIKLTRLGIASNQISAIPPEIGNLNNLTSLNLSGNQISAIPPEIGNLNNLIDLSLSGNQISAIPPEIGNLNNLTFLSLSNNQISAIPAEIGNLNNLTSLDLSGNQFTSFPEIDYLNNLTTLDLTRNQITSIPAEIGSLSNLAYLYLAKNQISAIPLEMGNLNNLILLRLPDNQISVIPPEMGNLNNLESLSLTNNQISCIPIELKGLSNANFQYFKFENNLLPQGFTWLNFSNSSYGACCKEATIFLPFQTTTIDCTEAVNFIPKNATYTNGLTGDCEQSGELSGVVDSYWNTCTGGFIIVKYDGQDNFGFPIDPQTQVINVLADNLAPQGDLEEIVITLASINDVPQVDELQMYQDDIANQFLDFCNGITVSVVVDSGDPECDVDGSFEKIYQMEVADACGNITGNVDLKFVGKCNPLYCTLSQSFYAGKSNPNFFSGLSSFEIVDELIVGGNNPINIGSGDCGFVLDNSTCIQQVLQGSGQSTSIPSGYDLNCSNPMNNALVNQMITTILNIRYNEQMLDLDLGNFQIAATCMNITGSIYNDLPNQATVNDLIDYANNFIGCQCTGTCNNYQEVMYELTGIFLGLNSRFNNCNEPAPCQLDGNGQSNMVANANSNTYVESKFVVTSIPKDLGEINIFPNPAKGEVFVDSNLFYQKTGTVSIKNNLGQILIQQNISKPTDDKIRFSTQNIKNGFYSITIQVAGEKPISKPLIIMK